MRKGPKCELSPHGIRRFGKALKSYLKDWKTEDLLYDAVPDARGWTLGGCGFLANSLKDWAPEFFTRELLTTKGFSHNPRRLFVGHVVAKIDGYYLDGNGASTERQLLKHWNSRAVHKYRLTPYNARQVRSKVCETIPGYKRLLAQRLKGEFGNPADWFCRK